jgi:hypothetical protein
MLPSIKSIDSAGIGDQLVGIPTNMVVQIGFLVVQGIAQDSVIDTEIARIVRSSGTG